MAVSLLTLMVLIVAFGAEGRLAVPVLTADRDRHGQRWEPR
jgi:hypothetical protein